MVAHKGMKKATDAEKAHLERVKQLPCCMCIAGEQRSVTEVHHIVRTKRLGHFYVLPLCKDVHHKHVSTLRQFEKTLWEQVMETLGVVRAWPESKIVKRA